MIIQNGVGITTLLNGNTVKQALNPANETVNRGIYNPTTLSAVDADLQVGNIKLAEVIFGFVGTFEETISTTELLFQSEGITGGVSTTWKDLVGLEATVPETAKKVETSIGVRGLDPTAGDVQVLYNGVQKATAAVEVSAFTIYGCRWEGDGLGFAADILWQMRTDSGTQVVTYSGACFYQTL